MNDSEARAFVDRMNAELQPADAACGHAEWRLNTTGDADAEAEVAAARARWMRLLSNPADSTLVKRLLAEADDAARASLEPQLRRQLEILRSLFLENGFSSEEIERISSLEAETVSLFNTHRGNVNGRRVSENDIDAILKSSTDVAERRTAWEASKEVGSIVRENVIELVRLRNAAARRGGFDNFYAMQLAAQEIDEDRLFATLGRLADLTDEPFRAGKSVIDAHLSATQGVDVRDLQPWNYSDLFFQERPDTGDFDLDALFAGADIEALTLATYDGIGFDLRGIAARSDLYERDGKDQHAFCVNIGRAGDVRVLCNLRDTARWMETNLHEFGHAVYDVEVDPELPYLLRGPAHTSSTEAIAMLMGRLANSPEWLTEVRGIERSVAERIGGTLADQLRMHMLVFVRWCLVMTHFERDLYRDPERPDLDVLWWDYVERFQLLSRPEGRSAPDWAAKIHLALAPVYYHNYMIGEMMASQIQHRLDDVAGGIVNRPIAGAYLRDKMFRPGASERWDHTVERVTGEPLSVEYFARQFIHRSSATT
ncbi:MAG: M2 family metallopeptidase [Blastocatellia bacterium]|nr:M2 family metallopeptidase [Blastocatellia bacterium]MBK6427264.1 M2 family metallopeptidase [Blastocatellia bacterium]